MFASAYFSQAVTLRRLLALGCYFSSGLAAWLCAQAPETHLRVFDLPAGVAEKTLKTFSEQSGRGLIVPAEVALNIRTNVVRGQFTVREALERMLAGTVLKAKEDPESGAFVVYREAPHPNAPRAARTSKRDRPTAPNPSRPAAPREETTPNLLLLQTR